MGLPAAPGSRVRAAGATQGNPAEDEQDHPEEQHLLPALRRFHGRPRVKPAHVREVSFQVVSTFASTPSMFDAKHDAATRLAFGHRENPVPAKDVVDGLAVRAAADAQFRRAASERVRECC